MYLKLFYAIKVSILGTKNSVFPFLPPHFAHWFGFKCCYPITEKLHFPRSISIATLILSLFCNTVFPFHTFSFGGKF